MTTTGLAVPPGRAGRLWLRQRLALADRAASLLDRKLYLLTAELPRLRSEAAATGQQWQASCAEAERWLLRAVLLGGERAIRLAPAVGQADVRITYTTTMGARHPASAQCLTGQAAGWEGPAVSSARAGHRAALEVAVRHAAATAALAAVEAETATTRYRLRALQHRWLPRLQQALAALEFSLEEQERADAARLRAASPASAALASRGGRNSSSAGTAGAPGTGR